MMIIGFAIFIVNGFLALFTLNIVIKQKRRDLISQCLVFLFTALLGIYYFAEEYLVEATFSLIVLGIPIVFLDNILPNFLKDNPNILRGLSIIPIISALLIIFL